MKRTEFIPFVHHGDSSSEETCTYACHAIIDAKVEGVLILGPNITFTQAHIKMLHDAGLPVTVIGGIWLEEVSRYQDGRREGFQMVTQHLIDEGYRSIMLFCSHKFSKCNLLHQMHITNTVDGFNSVVRSAKNRGLRFESQVHYISAETANQDIQAQPNIHGFYASGYLGMQELIRAKNISDAIAFQVDNHAIGAMRACEEAGLRIPEDVAIAGYGDEPTSSAGYISLTSVTHPYAQLAEMAVQELNAMAKGNLGPQHRLVTVPGQLVIRKSSIRHHLRKRSLA